MSTPSKLSQLRELSVVVADTGDYDAIKRLQPVDCTTNPTLVKKALDLPVYAELIERELAWGRQQSGDREAVVHAEADRLTIGVGALLSTLVPGRVSIEVDADQAHDTTATVAKARQFIQMYADAGVPREKILIKIAATWEGVEAARILQAEGRISFTELGERVGLSTTPCTERVRRLEREAVITGYHAHLDPAAVKASLLVFVEISLAYKSGDIFEEFRRAALKLPNVLECHLVSGDFDYLLKARISEMASYRKLLGSTLLTLPHVRESKSYIVMEEVKETLSLPIPD
ncbi:hypothetical protein G6F24_012939 [Rhizopus arrhizus]|nr:hypothetical protein G6F24_012939 [Rhizopus arrhizus]